MLECEIDEKVKKRIDLEYIIYLLNTNGGGEESG